jgi:hypothetical protein
MAKTYFPKVQKAILYEGKDSKNPFAFKYYNKDQRVGSKTTAGITSECARSRVQRGGSGVKSSCSRGTDLTVGIFLLISNCRKGTYRRDNCTTAANPIR